MDDTEKEGFSYPRFLFKKEGKMGRETNKKNEQKLCNNGLGEKYSLKH